MRIAIPQTSGNITETGITLETAITPELRKAVQAKMNFQGLNRVELRIPTYASTVDVSQLQSFIPAGISERKLAQGDDHPEIIGQSIIPDESYFRNTDKRGVWAFYIEVTAEDLKQDKLHVTFTQASEHVPGAPSNMLIALKQEAQAEETGRVIVTGQLQAA